MTEPEKEAEIREKVYELIDFYYSSVYPYILKYTVLIYTLGIDAEKESQVAKEKEKKIKIFRVKKKKDDEGAPKQLDYYKTDAFHDIAFALCDNVLTYEERLDKIAQAKEHIILNGIEYIEYYATKKLEYIKKRIYELKKWYRKSFFPKSRVYFDFRYDEIQRDEWQVIKEEKSKNFDKCRVELEKFIVKTDALQKEFFEEPKDNAKIIVYHDELKRYGKIKKRLSWLGGFVLSGILIPLFVKYLEILFL